MAERLIAFDTAQRGMDNFINDMRILSGDVVGPSHCNMHDVLQTALVNLGCVQKYLKQPMAFKVFPEIRAIDD